MLDSEMGNWSNESIFAETSSKNCSLNRHFLHICELCHQPLYLFRNEPTLSKRTPSQTVLWHKRQYLTREGCAKLDRASLDSHDCWQFVFLSKTGWEYKARRFRREGIGASHRRDTRKKNLTQPSRPYCSFILRSRSREINIRRTLREKTSCKLSSGIYTECAVLLQGRCSKFSPGDDSHYPDSCLVY